MASSCVSSTLPSEPSSLLSAGRQIPCEINLRIARRSAIPAAVIEAHLVPPSAFRTSQSMFRAIGPNASRSTAARSDLATSRSIS